MIGIPTLDSGIVSPDQPSLETELGYKPGHDALDDKLEFLAANKIDSSGAHAQEYLAQLKEANNKAAQSASYRFEDQDELATYRPGRIMYLPEFLSRLRRICWPVLNNYEAKGLIGLSVLQPNGTLAYVCGVQQVMPEYSQLRLGEHGEARDERYRGWRTVLVALLSGRHVTEQAINSAFPEPTAYGSGPYLKALKAIRQESI